MKLYFFLSIILFIVRICDTFVKQKTSTMKNLKRITLNPAVMGGKPCIRGLRMTVGTVIGLLASGLTAEEILKMYPYLQMEDLLEALSYAAWRSEEIEVPLATA